MVYNKAKILLHTVPDLSTFVISTMLSRLRSHFTALLILLVVVMMIIIVANQPNMFLADVMQWQWLTQHSADLTKKSRGNTIQIIAQKQLSNITQISFTIQHSPETTLATPTSSHEFFSNRESSTRIKIILRPQTLTMQPGQILIEIPYQGEPYVNISDLQAWQTDGSSLPLSIQS